jgi:alpha-beta hydrolase superfamily lysophospholipase
MPVTSPASPITAFDLVAPDGVHVTAYKALPVGAPRAIVQIAHGMAEHFIRYRRVVDALTGAGYAVYGQDHRGHGASAAAHGLGSFGPRGFAAVVDDMAALSRVAQAEYPGAPQILLGHSMGSFAAQLYLLDHHAGLAGLILSGTAAVDAMRDALIASGRPPSPNAMNAPFEPARTPFDWLSRDEAEVDAYIADPLCGFPLTDAARLSVFEQAAGARQDPRMAGVRHDLPVLVISGQFDPVTGPEQAFARALIESYAHVGLGKIDHRVYAGGRHELFNEIDRETVVRDVIDWLPGLAPPA